MQTKTNKIALIAMLSVIAYLAMVFVRIPVVLFLKYEPKDVVFTIGGFLFGPLTSFLMSITVSLVEMFTVSDTGPIGALMNVLSSCSFACTAAFIYKRRRTLFGAVVGLVTGCLCMVVVMLLWNYFIVPIYMGLPREEVAKMLIPYFLPFNLLKGGLNAAFVMLLYKPLKMALQKSNLLPSFEEGAGKSNKVSIGTILASTFVIITCILLILVLQGRM